MTRKPKRLKKSFHRGRINREGERVRPGSSAASLRKVGGWPLHEVLVSQRWEEEGALVEILVSRRSPLSQIAIGAFLVDLACLGVKSALARVFDSQSHYETEFRHEFGSHQPIMVADLDLVAKIIREGVAYARQLGFEPDPDFRKAMLVLGEANPDACPISIPLGGPEGKPLFVAGPYDDVPIIISKLTRAVGQDGFHYIVPIDPDTEFFVDES